LHQMLELEGWYILTLIFKQLFTISLAIQIPLYCCIYIHQQSESLILNEPTCKVPEAMMRWWGHNPEHYHTARTKELLLTCSS
jgi:hypothetical protein